MNILYHHRTQGKRVEGVHIREVVKALRNLGHTVIIVSPPGIDPFKIENVANTAGEKTSFISLLLTWISDHLPQFAFEIMEMGYNLFAYWNINKILSNNKIDFIYERYAFYNLAGVRAASKHKIPLILEVNEVSGLKRQRGQFFVKLTKKIERYIFEHADAIITVSTFLKSQLEEMKIISSKIHVLPNSVNIIDFDPNISGLGVRDDLKLQGRIVMGFMGTFSVWDNLEFLIATFAEISERYPLLALILIGDGSNKKQLVEDVSKRRLSEKIIFTGKIHHSQVAKHIAAMDLAVIPHSNPFGSPVVLFEYMAMGKAVIAPRLGPILDVIVENENGLLFDAGNMSGLKKLIIELYNSEELRKKIGACARKSILSRHLWQHNAEHVIDLYKRVK